MSGSSCTTSSTATSGSSRQRPIRAGDELTGTITIDTLRAAAGMDMIGTRTEISTIDGEPVATAFATLVHRGGA